MEAITGSWVSLTDPAVIEIMVDSGFDFLLLDGEHAPISEDSLKMMLMAARGSETALIYRVRENSEPLIKVALDLGADGLFVPMVNSAEQAQQAIDATRYPPQGRRGIGPWRASNYYNSLAEYVAGAREQITLFLQIEDRAALPHLDDILSVDGFDAAYIGPADLTASHNLYPDRDHPEVLASIDRIIAACKRHQVPLGIDASGPEEITRLREAGLQIFTYGMDVSYLHDGVRATAQTVAKALAAAR